MIYTDLIDKSSKITISESALMSLVSIIIVFLVLFIIIGITELVFKFTGLLDLKKSLEANKNSDVVISKNDIKDDDMMVALLVASIDYQEETKKDVKLVSIREVK